MLEGCHQPTECWAAVACEPGSNCNSPYWVPSGLKSGIKVSDFTAEHTITRSLVAICQIVEFVSAVQSRPEARFDVCNFVTQHAWALCASQDLKNSLDPLHPFRDFE